MFVVLKNKGERNFLLYIKYFSRTTLATLAILNYSISTTAFNSKNNKNISNLQIDHEIIDNNVHSTFFFFKSVPNE